MFLFYDLQNKRSDSFFSLVLFFSLSSAGSEL